jgi:hypothetical protein
MSTLYAFANNEFKDVVVFKDDADDPLDITGHTCEIRVAKYYNSETFMEDTATIVGSPLNGTFEFVVPAVDMTVPSGANVYTRILKDALGKPVSIQNGAFIVMPTVGPKPVIPPAEEPEE